MNAGQPRHTAFFHTQPSLVDARESRFGWNGLHFVFLGIIGIEPDDAAQDFRIYFGVANALIGLAVDVKGIGKCIHRPNAIILVDPSYIRRCFLVTLCQFVVECRTIPLYNGPADKADQHYDAENHQPDTQHPSLLLFLGAIYILEHMKRSLAQTKAG